VTSNEIYVTIREQPLKIWFNAFLDLHMNQIRMPSFGYRIDGVEYRDPKYGLK
jgi:hypothetical protein